MAENIIEDHLKGEDFGQQRDIVGTMLATMANPNSEFFSTFDRENVKGIMLDLFVGGIDSSLQTIMWALSALTKHPRVMKLLQEELDAKIGRHRMVLESDLPKLTYLDMVVKETFRLHPVGPLLVPHESMEDVIVDGYMIPKKSRVIINFYAIGHDPNVWSENVEDFYPERFMGRETDVRGQDFELIPFGAGRRGCPGIHLGLITVKIVLAQLVHCFNWELPNGMRPEEVDMTEEFGLAMSRVNKLLAIPSYRLLLILKYH